MSAEHLPDELVGEKSEEIRRLEEHIADLKDEVRWLRSQIEGPRHEQNDTLPFDKLKEIGERFLRENGIEPPDPFFKTSPETDEAS
jgi:hypothetical protein